MTSFPFTITYPDIWLKNSWLEDESNGIAPAATDFDTFAGITTWQDTGTAGYADWSFSSAAELQKIDSVFTVTRNAGVAPTITSPSGINPTSVTVGLVIHTFSTVNEDHIFGKTNSLVIGHPSSDNLRVVLNGSETITAPDGLRDVGGFNGHRMVIVRFTEGAGGGSLDAWVNGTKVIDNVGTTAATLDVGTSEWFFGPNDHRFGEIVMYESAITDDEVDYLFGHWAWESSFAYSEFQDELISPHPYASAGPLEVSLQDTPGYLEVWGDGTDAILKLRRVVNGNTFGAWSESGWSWSEDPSDLIKGITITQDGANVNVKRLRRQSTPKSLNPNAAILDPHVSDENFGVTGNWLEMSLVLEEPILQGSTVRWSINEGIFTESGGGNTAIDNQYANLNNSLYKTNFVEDRIQNNAKVVYISKNGTLPKLPDLEAGLTTDFVYTEGSSIDPADFNSDANVLFVLQANIEATAEGLVFEIGDNDYGVFCYTDGSQLTFAAGSSLDREVKTFSTNATSSNIVPREDYSGTETVLGFHINGNTFDLYWEGVLIDSSTVNGVSMGSWTGASAIGSFSATADGGYFYSDVQGSLASETGLTRTELRVYSNPDLSGITLGSKDWYNPPNILRPRDIYFGKSWETEYTRYLYNGLDYANPQTPGSVDNVCGTPEFGYFILQDTNEFGFNLPDMHFCVLYEAGQTWTYGVDTRYRTPIRLSTLGTSRERPVVYGGYSGDGLVTFDCSSYAAEGTDVEEYVFIEPGRFKIIGSGTETESCLGFAAQDGASVKDFWIGGMHFKDWGTSGISIVQYDESTTADAGNLGNGVFGVMCYENISIDNSRGSCFSVAGPNGAAAMNKLKHHKSYWGCGYSAGGFSNQQAHGMYIKGWVPYLFIEGGWIPSGPGGQAKLDTNKDLVLEDVVGWDHKGTFGFHNNGSTTDSVWGFGTDRTIRQGRHGDRVLVQDFVASRSEDFTGRIVSHVHSECRRGIFTSVTDNRGLFFGYNGTSIPVAEAGGDSWYSGWSHITTLLSAKSSIQIPWSNDRTQDRTYGVHYGYLNRALMVKHDQNDTVFELENAGESSDLSYNEHHDAGHITSFKINNSNFGGVLNDVEEVVITISGISSGWTAGGGVIDAYTTNEGVTFADATLANGTTIDPLLEYFTTDLGYADYGAVAEEIVNAWNGVDWSGLTAGLQTETIRRAMAAKMRPTNLTTSNYENSQLPGYVLPQVTSYTPSVGGTPALSSPVSLTYDMPIVRGYGTIEIRRSSDDALVDSMNVLGATTSGNTITFTDLDLSSSAGESLYAVVPAGAVLANDGQMENTVLGKSEWYWTMSDDSGSTSGGSTLRTTYVDALYNLKGLTAARRVRNSHGIRPVAISNSEANSSWTQLTSDPIRLARGVHIRNASGEVMYVKYNADEGTGFAILPGKSVFLNTHYLNNIYIKGGGTASYIAK